MLATVRVKWLKQLLAWLICLIIQQSWRANCSLSERQWVTKPITWGIFGPPSPKIMSYKFYNQTRSRSDDPFHRYRHLKFSRWRTLWRHKWRHKAWIRHPQGSLGHFTQQNVVLKYHLIPTRTADRQTDRQTDMLSQYCPSVCSSRRPSRVSDFLETAKPKTALIQWKYSAGQGTLREQMVIAGN